MELELVNLLAKDKPCITNSHDFNLAEHLTNDYTDMLIIDAYTLCTVYGLDFIHKVILQCVFTKNCKDICRVWSSVTKLFSSLYFVTIADNHVLTCRNKVFVLISEHIFNFYNTLCLCNSLELNASRNLCKYSLILWFASFEQFCYTWDTTCNIVSLSCFFRHLCKCFTSLDCLLIFNLKNGTCRKVIATHFVTSFVSNQDTRLLYIKVKVCNCSFRLTSCHINLFRES